MIQMLKEILAYRDLIIMLTLRDLRIRYKQAAMGFLWAIFMPVVAVLAGVLIKKAMAMVSQNALASQGVVSIAVKVLPWTFFISSIRFCVLALVANSSLVTKIYFPRAVLILSCVLACFFDFTIAMAVLIVLLLVFKVGFSIYILWLPALLGMLVIYTFGLGLLLSAANLFYRDIKYVVEIILMFGIFFTPVFYSATAFGRWKPLMLLNPLGSILEEMDRVVVFHQMPDLAWMAYALIASFSVFMLGVVIFHNTEPYFAENI